MRFFLLADRFLLICVQYENHHLIHLSELHTLVAFIYVHVVWMLLGEVCLAAASEEESSAAQEVACWLFRINTTLETGCLACELADSS